MFSRHVWKPGIVTHASSTWQAESERRNLRPVWAHTHLKPCLKSTKLILGEQSPSSTATLYSSGSDISLQAGGVVSWLAEGVSGTLQCLAGWICTSLTAAAHVSLGGPEWLSCRPSTVPAHAGHFSQHSYLHSSAPSPQTFRACLQSLLLAQQQVF